MSSKPKTVLIVDDDEGMRDTLTAILKREFRILRVASGERTKSEQSDFGAAEFAPWQIGATV